MLCLHKANVILLFLRWLGLFSYGYHISIKSSTALWSSVLNELLYNAESRRQNHNIFHELNFERLPKNVWVDNIDNTPYVDNVSIAFYRQHYYRADNISDFDNAIIAVYRQIHYRSVQCYVCVVDMRYRWCCKTEEKSMIFCYCTGVDYL